MKLDLKVRPDLTCNICLKPISDFTKANVFWRSRERGHPMLAIAHAQTCDTPDIWRRYSTWEHLHRLIDRQKEMRLYFASKIRFKEFTREDVKEGLEAIFISVPDEYFNVSDEELLRYFEESI